MADAYFELEEYLWFNETIQGNVNVAGLVYDDLLEETIDLGPEEVLTVYSDVIEEELDIAETVFDGGPGGTGGAPHWPVVSDTIAFTEQGGPPMRVRQSVLNLVMTTPVVPALIAHVHMDVLHGVDIFWEEVSSELQVHSNYVNAVPYWWEWIYEEFWIDMTEAAPLPPIILILKLMANDLVNMRHDVVQEYYFSSSIQEFFFVFDALIWGWGHENEEDLDIAEAVQEIIGKVADEHLFLQEVEDLRLKVKHTIDDRFFIFDRGIDEKYYIVLAADALGFEDALQAIFGHAINDLLSFVSHSTSKADRYPTVPEEIDMVDNARSEKYYIEIADDVVEFTDGVVAFIANNVEAAERFEIDESAVAIGKFEKLASESLVFADLSAYIYALVIEDGLDIGDVMLERWIFQVLIECGFDAADIIS